MSDDTYSFSTARARLDEIVTQVRKKDTSLEKSLDLLEEGVRLANACTELIDHADWTVGGAADVAASAVVETDAAAGSDSEAAIEQAGVETGAETVADGSDDSSPGPEDALSDADFDDALDEAWSEPEGDPTSEAE